MAGHGMNKTGIKKNGGRRSGIKTKGRTKPTPQSIAIKKEQEMRNRKKHKRT